MTWILDLDGVVWLGDTPIAGSPEAVAALRHRGEAVLFVTNNSSATVAEYLAKLARVGIDGCADELVTSAQVAAGLVEPGARVLVCAGAGVDEALAARGAIPVRGGTAEPVDAVMVGWHREFDYEELTGAMTAVRGGARLVGTNDDATYPTPDGAIPGGGAILAAVAYAAGVTPTVAGKPHPPTADFVRPRMTPGSVMVGDRPSTDGLLARRLGIRFALVLSGVTTRADLPTDPEPDVVADDLAALVAAR